MSNPLLNSCSSCFVFTKHPVQLKTVTTNDTHTHTHPFNGPLSGTTWVSQCQKGKTNLDFSEARDSEWQWHRLDHMQVCTSLQTDNHANTPLLQSFTGRMPFLLPNQQRQSTEGNNNNITINRILYYTYQCSLNAYGDCDVISFHIYASWCSPPFCL